MRKKPHRRRTVTHSHAAEAACYSPASSHIVLREERMKAVARGLLVGLLVVAPLAAQGGRGAQSPGPSVTVNGQTWTQQSLFQRNIGGPDD